MIKNEELRAYLGVVAGAVILITINILHIYGSPLRAFRYASFQVSSDPVGALVADPLSVQLNHIHRFGVENLPDLFSDGFGVFPSAFEKL